MSTMDNPNATTESTTEQDGDKMEQKDETTNDNSDMISKSQHDADLSKAVHTALAKQQTDFQLKLDTEKAEAEQKRLVDAGKHEEAYTNTQAELDRLKADNKVKAFKLEANALLTSRGLGQFANVLTDGTTDIDAVIARADKFSDAVTAGIDEGVNQRLDSNTSIPKTNTTNEPKTPDNMNADEFKAYKVTNGLI